MITRLTLGCMLLAPMVNTSDAFAANNFYLQATTQLAATNFDYISASYYNSSIEGLYNFESTPFIVGVGLGQIHATTDNLYEANGGVYNSNFTLPYVSILAGVLLRPLPKISSITTFKVAQSFSERSTCNASTGYSCNHGSVDLMMIGFRSNLMYYFTPNFYASFNAGLDINNFSFSPGFSSNPAISISKREYTNPGPNLGFSIGTSF